MNPTHIAMLLQSLLQSMSGLASRRSIIGGLASGLLVTGIDSVNVDDADARKKGKRKKKRKNTKDRTQTRVDAICPGPTDNAGLALNDESFLAQTFTALNSGRLVRADALIFASSTGSADLTLQLRDINASGVPTDEVLAEASISTEDVPDGESTVSFSFADPPAVAATREYALVLSKRGSRNFSWKGHGGDTCDGQPFRSEPNTEPFESQNFNGLDFMFTTVVRF